MTSVKRAVAVVAVAARRGIEAGDVQVVEAVAIVVSDGNALTVTPEGHARGECDIGEGAVAVVAVELCGVPEVGRAREG